MEKPNTETFSLVVLIVPTLTLIGTAQNKPNRRPPNIVLVMTDDLGWRELGSYGNRFNETPHLDRFAREGLRLTNAYSTAPVCSPTRACLMTGQNPGRHLIINLPRKRR